MLIVVWLMFIARNKTILLLNKEEFMKKFLILVVLVASCLVAGCVGKVQTYTDPGQSINVSTNQEFVIALESNRTTGYLWEESYDESMLKLVESRYELGKEAEQGLVGAGGVDYFRFKALKAGETEITMTHKRPWEEEVLEQRVFRVSIK
ncbi:MAG: hypothetical protein E3J75_04890 [Dehalococcoidia bacterium]|nr:MAG: hypothetical protein E3J75_04890 [Dehalococcoidia bacterium]